MFLRNREDCCMRKIVLSAALLLAMIGLLQAQAPAPAPTPRSDAEKKAIARVQQLGGLALDLAQNDNRLEVSYLQTDGKLTDEHLAVLKQLKGLVHLNL